MLLPSKHYFQFDAVTHTKGSGNFDIVAGKVRHLSKKPRYWRVNVSLRIETPTTIKITPFTFNSQTKLRLSELAPIINQEIHKYIHNINECTSCVVTAYILTEGGKK